MAGLPAVLPPFAKAAWLSVVPEFNPFKYNSFPVNGARQSYRLTDALQSQIQRLARAGQLGSLPPVLTFQSVVDFTVGTPAILTALYAFLPDNGSEIVLFDVNRTVKFVPLLRPSAYVALDRLTPTSPQPYRFTSIINASDDSDATVERSTAPGQLQSEDHALSLYLIHRASSRCRTWRSRFPWTTRCTGSSPTRRRSPSSASISAP